MLIPNLTLTPEDLNGAIAHHPLIVSPETTVLAAITQLHSNDLRSSAAYLSDPAASCILVAHEQQPLGFLTEHDVVRLCAQGVSLDQPIQKVMATPLLTLQEAEFKDPVAILGVLNQHQMDHLALVGDRGQITGLITRTSLHECLHFIELHRAEQANAQKLRLELSILKAILDIILAGYWNWDIPSDCAYLSPGFKHMFGYADHELPNATESWQTLIFPEDLVEVMACFDRHTQSHGNIPFYNEVRYRHKNGSTVWVVCSGQVVAWDDAGKPLQMIGCHINITRRKQAEEQLQKSDAHLKTAQRIAKLGSWEFDLATERIHWSDEVFQIFGRDPTAGMPSFEELQQLYHPDDQAYHNQTVQQGIKTGQPYDLECRAHRPDGSLIYIQARGEPIFDATGQLRQLVGTVLDITDRKAAEAKILQTTAQLKASNRELEAFAYSVSHDLRSPLRAIDGFSKALLEDYGDQFDAEGKDYFDRIRRNVQRMGHLIEDLLRLSRISRSEMQYSTLDLGALVLEQIKELRATDPDRQIEVVVASQAIVSADPTLMRVVISNLLQNAWKFTSHQATARIEFGILENQAQPDEPHIYFVSDNGAGFDMAYANMLFGVFQRLHNTTEFPGTGIGLATVQRAIHRHGGQVWAEGVVEQGATIYFTLLPINRVQTSGQESTP